MITAKHQDSLILIDAHVHLYNCFDLDCFLDSALENFSTSARDRNSSDRFTSLLLLTETSSDRYFQKLSRSVQKRTESTHLPDRPSLKKWTIRLTQENCSLYAHLEDARGLYIIAGRQIVTAENLEVLALATEQDIEDGQPLETTIERTIAAGGIPVIPWGFGKWIGRRGKILSNLLEEHQFPVLFLGDNSGRPVFWSRPPLFKQAERLGMRVLPGTDPLPFASESFRPGTFGFALQGQLDPEKPARSLKQLLLEKETQIQAYGSLENPWRFIRNQIAMQIVKRQRRKA